MTSYTKKLYETSPSAAQSIRRQEFRDYRYGKHVTLAMFVPDFGKRPASERKACAENCGSPACAQGCTLVSRRFV